MTLEIMLARTNPSVLYCRSTRESGCKSYFESGELTHSSYTIYTESIVAVLIYPKAAHKQ